MVTWKCKTPQVLLQTHSMSGITGARKQTDPNPGDKLELYAVKEFRFLPRLEPLTTARKLQFSSVFSKCQFPFHPIAANWAEITPNHSCLCGSIIASGNAGNAPCLLTDTAAEPGGKASKQPERGRTS